MIQPDQGEIGEINVTPFIDVMLVLLIIFMVAAPLSTVDIPVDLPQSSAAATPRPDQTIWLTITETGEWVLGQNPVAKDNLGPALTAAIADKAVGLPAEAAPPPIYLRADHRLDYGAVVAAMNALSALGHTRVALVTEEALP